MNALLSLNHIVWQTGVLLFQDMGEMAKKFKRTNRAETIPNKLESSNRQLHESKVDKPFQKDPRHAKRVEIALPVSLNNRKSFTHDFSEAGVFIVSETPYKNGEQVEFSISVDQLLSKLILRCSGKVVRAGQRQGKSGFAVKIVSQVLESEKDTNLHPLQYWTVTSSLLPSVLFFGESEI